MPKQPKLYALLVGVMEYAKLPPKMWLTLPFSDVLLMKEYLNEPYVKAHFGEPQILTLMSPFEDEPGAEYPGGPTKANVVKAIKKHLGKAEKGDVALLYYSGHGIRENTDVRAFQKAEVDGNIAGLALYDYSDPKDDPDTPGKTVLADKEIRYLIRQLAEDEAGNPKARVITIFDSCHSGGNTKSFSSNEEGPRSKQIVRTAIRGRDASDFIFFADEQVKQKWDEGASVKEMLPMANHVMFAACKEVELAWEGRKCSVFTEHLIGVLREHKGQISYQELQSRVFARMNHHFPRLGFKDKRQTPQLFIYGTKEEDQFKNFLTDELNAMPATCAVEKSTEDDEWRIDRGFMHYVPLDQESAQTELIVYPVGKSKADGVKGTISQVFLTNSVVTFDQEPDPGQKPFVGELKGLGIPPMVFAISGDKADTVTAAIQQMLDNERNPLFQLEQKEESAAYIFKIQDRKGQLFEGAVPVLKQEWILEKDGSLKSGIGQLLFHQFNQIAQWALYKDRERKRERPDGERWPADAQDFPVELRFYKYNWEEEKEERLYHKDGKLVLDLMKEKEHPDFGEPIIYLRVEVVSYYSMDMKVSVVNMPIDFSFQVMDGANSEEVKKGNPIELPGLVDIPNGKSYFAIRVADYTLFANMPYETFWLKLISSRMPYDISTLQMSGLNLANVEIEQETKSKGGFGFEDEEEADIPPEPILPKDFWEVRNYEVTVTNPEFKEGG